MSTTPRTNSKPTPAWDPSIASRLVGAVGPTLVSALAGASEPEAVNRWMDPSGVPPTQDQARRMRFALEQWDLLEQEDGADVSRMWLIGANPMLGDTSAIEAIAEGRFHSVRAAVENFVSGG